MNNFKREDVEQAIVGRALVQTTDLLPKGYLRIETGFLYPDGSNIDLFLKSAAQPGLFDKLTLSDLGETSAWLLDVQVKPWLSKKRQALLDDAIAIYGVSKQGGALQLDVERLDQLPDAIVRLGQACVRVADLSYTRRASLQSAFTEDVEEVIIELELNFDRDFELLGRNSHPVRVDCLVSGHHSQSALLMWSTSSSSSAHTQANEIFRKWYDLDVPQRGEQRVTVLDDRFDVYKDEDIDRIKNFAEVLAFSQHKDLRDLLAA